MKEKNIWQKEIIYTVFLNDRHKLFLLNMDIKIVVAVIIRLLYYMWSLFSPVFKVSRTKNYMTFKIIKEFTSWIGQIKLNRDCRIRSPLKLSLVLSSELSNILLTINTKLSKWQKATRKLGFWSSDGKSENKQQHINTHNRKM